MVQEMIFEPSGPVGGSISEPAALARADVVSIADDDVVENVHAAQPSGVDQPSRQRQVVRARRRVAARVIVRLMCLAWLCS